MGEITVKIINQRHEWDCGIAATAMFVELDYDETKKKYFCHSNTEISVREIIKTLEKDFPMIHRMEYASMSTNNLDHHNAILLIPSKNNKMGAHYVFWDGNGILDPQKGRDEKEFYEYYELAPVIWIVRQV